MLNHACNLIEKEWVKFESEVDPQNISFTLDEVLYNDEEDIISNGIMMSLDYTDLY